MRYHRVRIAFFVSALTALAAAPAAAQTPYDGLWNVTIVTKTGACEPSTRSTLTVADGKVSKIRSRTAGDLSAYELEPQLVTSLFDAEQRSKRHVGATQLQHADLSLRDVHQCVENRENPIGFLQTVRQRLVLLLGIAPQFLVARILAVLQTITIL